MTRRSTHSLLLRSTLPPAVRRKASGKGSGIRRRSSLLPPPALAELEDPGAIAPLDSIHQAENEYHDRYRLLLSCMQEGVMLVDLGGRIIEGNESASAVFAHDGRDLAEMRLPDLFSEDGLVQVANAMDSLISGAARIQAMRLSAIDAKGQDSKLDIALGLLEKNMHQKTFLIIFEKPSSYSERPVPCHSARLASRLSIRKAVADASSAIRTDLATLSERMRHVQRRIEEIGFPDLASGISGSINLLDSSSVVAGGIPDPLDMASMTKLEIDMNRVLFTAMLSCGKRLEDPRIEIKTDLERNLFIIDGDPLMLERAVSNIIINAVDAMPDGGELAISSMNLPGRSPISIKVSISDTGFGMDEEVMALMFDPSFTTKGIHGTGLGLAISKTIIDAHGGIIDVQSHPGFGTKFDITFSAS